MLTIRPPPQNPSSPPKRLIPNLLPCHIHHNGPVATHTRYWNPQPAKDDGRPEAYFRGRKLRGREVRVPDGYRGVVVRDGVKVENQSGRERRGMGVDDEEEEEEEVKVMEEVASFEKYVVWGHENVVEGDDGFVKGVEEWVRFTDKLHKPGLEEEKGEEGKR
ncbi:MAG: hypothetical protein Q9220_005429 [cf. Caloplaca sp. 1 TL-2023]